MYSFDDKILILDHVSKFGISSAIHAFNVGDSSIYSWQKKLTESYGNKNCLKNKSTKPLRCRSRVGNWDYRITEFIRKIRIKHLGLSHEKIHILLLKKAELYSWECKLPSSSTIARIVSDLKKDNFIPKVKPSLSFYANTSTFRIKLKKRIKKNRPKKKEFTSPGQRIQIDCIVLLLLGGLRRYIIQATDVYSRITFSYGVKTLNSRATSLFFDNLQLVMPYINDNTEIQTDNGSEFLKHFKQKLETLNITQYWNYPRSPKMNAYVERMNRTAQEEFIYKHAYLMKDNMQEFNEKLMEYLVWYNTERPHFSLDLKSPLEFILHNNQFSKMWWEDTNT